MSSHGSQIGCGGAGLKTPVIILGAHNGKENGGNDDPRRTRTHVWNFGRTAEHLTRDFDCTLVPSSQLTTLNLMRRAAVSCRSFSTSPSFLAQQAKGKFQWGRPSSVSFDTSDLTLDTSKFTRLTAEKLATYRTPPKGISTLVRDFIHDALYNPFYGYFSHHAVIFSPSEPFNFREFQNSTEFDEHVARVYAEITKEKGLTASNIGAQLWHTPVELFQVRS